MIFVGLFVLKKKKDQLNLRFLYSLLFRSRIKFSVIAYFILSLFDRLCLAQRS